MNIEDRVVTPVSKISGPQRLNWPTTIVMALFHIGAIAALFFFSWRVFAASVFLYWFATGLGISMGYHRLLTHRSYKVPRLLEY
ncbi:MAG: acyl-CoA desaturase, partial [Bryobacteraceae bacterium]